MNSITRKEMLRQLSAGAVGAGASALFTGFKSMSQNSDPLDLKGSINHSMCRWTFGDLPLDQLCQTVKEIGFSAIDLIGPGEWDVLKEHDIDSSMCNGAEISLEEGWCEPDYHSTLIDNYTEHIDLVADAGYTNLICFTGNKRGMDDETGLQNCVAGLEQIMGHAERRGVVLQLELFNSKIDHPDYMADNSAFGVELCKRLDSPNFKLLYDIYHMQISEGDIIRTIREDHEYFGHYHTAGVPGRNEIDESQELYYPAIMEAIVETGFEGYVAQEFIATQDTMEENIAMLRDAVSRCDV
ncbi:MAG: TIM barrel protein [Balneolaceae bacterium]